METKMPDSLEKVVAAAAWGSGGRGEMLIGLLLNADTAAKKVFAVSAAAAACRVA